MRLAVAGGTGTVGRLVVDAARADGHDVVVLTRSSGVDLVAGTGTGTGTGTATGAGLAERLAGVDAVVDVSSVTSTSTAASRRFFGAVTAHLLQAGAAAGVGHHVALSVVGCDRAPYGHYAGKVEQERLVAAGPVPWTLLRATQFLEFAPQVHAALAVGPVHPVPVMRSQPVAAAEVARRLLALAVAAPAGRARDLAGPQEVRMAGLVRAWARRAGRRGPVVPVTVPGPLGRAFRDGTLLPGPDADRGTTTPARWLADVVGR
ncbi:SDR family oxidoreductase [Cellulomonas endophytica]|uniref:SDR family oxidoreductase n=1 Tax=Cellulomonas endophytica TaxID=2494735 RepID=UPI001012F1E2|nr:SDR family oxidoreductase [Cellulomonas endophytica]